MDFRPHTCRENALNRTSDKRISGDFVGHLQKGNDLERIHERSFDVSGRLA